jgi:ribosomal protein S18 acetylase RimI-like enzyme
VSLPSPSVPDLRFSAMFREWARCGAVSVEATVMGAATLLLCPELPRFIGYNRALDVDPREPGLAAALVARARQAGCRAVLEIAAEHLEDAHRDELRRLGLELRGPLVVLSADLHTLEPRPPGGVAVRDVHADEAEAFGALAVRAYEIPPRDRADHERVWTGCARTGRARCFVAEIDGAPGAMSALYTTGEIVFVDGAATLPEHRRRGLQNALLDHRLRVARGMAGARYAVSRAREGSASQRNVERAGLRVFRQVEVWGERAGA